MPCYSTIQTKLTDLEAVKKAAEILGHTVETRSGGSVLTINSANATISIYRRGAAKFLNAEADLPDDRALLTQVTRQYAIGKVKDLARKKGYLVSQGTKPGQYVLTSYR